MDKSKRVKKWIGIMVVILLLLIYPTYFLIVQIVTKSDSISLFPSEGVWTAEADGFSMTFDLDNNAITLTLNANGEVVTLDEQVGGGHGTPFYPTSAHSILYYTSKCISEDNENYTDFSCSKFKFNESDFYFYNIYVYETNNLPLITQKLTLHFVKQG